MANSSKKYFWLKLKEDFFRQKEMKKLRKIAGGDTFTIIYLKLMLLSMKTDGLLEFSGIEETFAEELALEIDEDADNVGVTLNFLQKCGLVEILDNSEILLTKVTEMTGKESESAERVRKLRDRKKLLALQCNVDVTKSNTEIEIDIEKEKEIDTDIIKNVRESILKLKEFLETQFNNKLTPTQIDKLVMLSIQYEVNPLEIYNNSDYLRGFVDKKPTWRMWTSNAEATLQNMKAGQYVNNKNKVENKSEFEFNQERFDRINKLVEVADVSALTNKDRDYYNKCQEYLRG